MWYNNGTLNQSEACPLGWNYDPEIGPTIVTDVRYKIILVHSTVPEAFNLSTKSLIFHIRGFP